jgi:hypothetical protein
MVQTKFCRDCYWSKPEPKSEWNLRCHNPKVAGSDEWNLSSATDKGTDCRVERSLAWFIFPACGKAGKQYKNRLDSLT